MYRPTNNTHIKHPELSSLMISAHTYKYNNISAPTDDNRNKTAEDNTHIDTWRYTHININIYSYTNIYTDTKTETHRYKHSHKHIQTHIHTKTHNYTET